MGGYNLYVGNWGSNEVYIVDTNSNTMVDTLRGFDYYIWDLAITLSGAKLYVSTKGGLIILRERFLLSTFTQKAHR